MYQENIVKENHSGGIVNVYQGPQQQTDAVNEQLKQIQSLLVDEDSRLQQKFEELKAELKVPPKKDRKAFWEGVFSMAKNGVEIAASLVKIFAPVQ